MVKIILEDKQIGVSYMDGTIYIDELNNMWLWLLGAIKQGEKIVIQDHRDHLEPHQFRLDCVTNEPDEISNADYKFVLKKVKKAEEYLIGKGLSEEEVPSILQNLGYILLDRELYPEA